MTNRERSSMALLKNIFDAYYELPLGVRVELDDSKFSKKVDEIPAVLKLYKSEVGKEISAGVEISGVNERFNVAVDSETKEIIVL